MRARAIALFGVCFLLLAPAMVLTLFRLVEPPWNTGVQAVSFTPFAIPLYAAALLLVAVGMLVRRTTGVPYVVTAGIAAAGLALHSWWFAPLVTGAAPEPAAGAEEVVVMTANVYRGAGDSSELMGEARERGVDVLVVAEVTESSLAAMEAAGLEELLPHREGRPGPEGDVPGTMVFSDEPTRLVDVLDTELDAVVVDTHDLRLIALHPKQPAWLDDWHDDHAVISAAVDEHDPDLLVGDFNATADHEPMRDLADAGYRDAVELTNGGVQATWPVNGTFGLLGRFGPVVQIDHVLVGDAWTALDADAVEINATDHKAVIATVARR